MFRSEQGAWCRVPRVVYEKALVVALCQKGLRVAAQVPLKVAFRGVIVGDFYADLVVEERVIVELKAVTALAPEHQAQVINYLRATGIDVGLLVNFGRPKLETGDYTDREGHKPTGWTGWRDRQIYSGRQKLDTKRAGTKVE